ncbi:MAG: M24 family metallopeptidase [Anaerolineae bacterium]
MVTPRTGSGERMKLKEGMVLCLEPRIFIGWGGCSIEEEVIVGGAARKGSRAWRAVCGPSPQARYLLPPWASPCSSSSTSWMNSARASVSLK